MPYRCPGAHIIIAYAPLDEDQAGRPTMEHQMRLWLEPIQTVSSTDECRIVELATGTNSCVCTRAMTLNRLAGLFLFAADPREKFGPPHGCSNGQGVKQWHTKGTAPLSHAASMAANLQMWVPMRKASVCRFELLRALQVMQLRRASCNKLMCHTYGRGV